MEMIDNSKEVIAAMNEQVEAAMVAIGLFLEGEAKIQIANDPKRIDTGRLRNSISFATHTKQHSEADSPQDGNPNATPEEKTVYIGTNVEYAPYVHEGTSRMLPNHFLRNAVNQNINQCKNYLQNALMGSDV